MPENETYNPKIIPLPSPELVQHELPLPLELAEIASHGIDEITKIIKGEDSRKLMIVGPCSAWPAEDFLEYVEAMLPVIEETRDNILTIIRAYIQKPRTVTNEDNWSGPIYQPDIFKPIDLAAGIRYCRAMLIKALDLGVPLADEMLFIDNGPNFERMLSWIAVGARNSESGVYRAHASDLFDEQREVFIPVGLKNPTDGNVKKGVNSVLSAQSPNVMTKHYPFLHQKTSRGNPLAHLILRGGDKTGPNYATERLQRARDLMRDAKIKNPAIIVDASHDNSFSTEKGKKDPMWQPQVLRDNLESLAAHPDLPLIGWMMESFKQTGNQQLPKRAHLLSPEEQAMERAKLIPGLSKTDACIGLPETIAIMREASQRVAEIRRKS